MFKASRQFESWGSLALLGILSLSACKPLRSESGPANAPLATDLNVGFYLSDEAGGLPDPQRPAPGNLMHGSARDGGVIQLKHRISISPTSDPQKKVFLAFSENLNGRKIVEASYEHRVQLPSNEIRGGMQRALLSYDRDSHFYFLALDGLAQDRGEKLSSLDLQILVFSFRLNDGSNLDEEIRFYVKGELPELDQVRVSQKISSHEFVQGKRQSVLDAEKTIAQHGALLSSERYVNPTNRPILLWFQPKPMTIELETLVGMHLDWMSYETRFIPSEYPDFEPDLHQISKSALDDFRLVVKRPNSEDSQILSIQTDQATSIRLAPGQALDIEWRASAKSAQKCADGAPDTRQIWLCRDEPSGFVRHWRPSCGFLEPLTPVSAPLLAMNVPAQWSLMGYRVRGRFDAEVSMTEDFESLGSAREAGLARSWAAPEVREQTFPEVENLFSSATPFQCQGIF